MKTFKLIKENVFKLEEEHSTPQREWVQKNLEDLTKNILSLYDKFIESGNHPALAGNIIYKDIIEKMNELVEREGRKVAKSHKFWSSQNKNIADPPDYI